MLTIGVDKHIKKLSKNRIQGFLADPAVVVEYLSTNDIGVKIVKHPLPINSDDVYIMVSKKSPQGDEILKSLNYVLEKTKGSNEYQEILSRYIS